MSEIPPQLSSWNVDEVIEALSFSKAFGWDSNEQNEVQDELMRLVPDAYEPPGTPLGEVWDQLDYQYKNWIIRAYNADIYGKNNPIDTEKYLNEDDMSNFSRLQELAGIRDTKNKLVTEDEDERISLLDELREDLTDTEILDALFGNSFNDEEAEEHYNFIVRLHDLED